MIGSSVGLTEKQLSEGSCRRKNKAVELALAQEAAVHFARSYTQAQPSSVLKTELEQ